MEWFLLFRGFFILNFGKCIIPAMAIEEISVRALPTLKDAIKEAGQTFAEWFRDQAALAEAIDEGRIFQKVGKEYIKLSIRDVRPYQVTMSDLKDGEAYEAVVFSADIENSIKKKAGDFKTWVLRVINLGIMAPRMNLHCLDDNGEYNLLISSPEATPEI